MKIVHLIYSFNYGGVETMLVDIINEQCKYADIALLVINKLYSKELLATVDTRVSITLLNRPCGSKNPLYIVKAATVLRKICPHIIHCHEITGTKMLPFNKIPRILTLHNERVNLCGIDRYDKIVAISDTVKEYILQKNREATVEVIQNGIYPHKIIMRNHIFRRHPKRIIQIGRLERIKGQDILIRALSILQTQGLDFRIDFVGDGKEKDTLIALSKECGVAQHIRFLGGKTRQEIYTMLKDYDVLVHPSRKEGFGITIIEAMAARLPVLVANIPAPMDLIDNGRLGHFFQSESSQDLAAKLQIMLAAPENIEMLDNAQQKVFAQFDITRVSNKYLQIYSRFLKQ